MSDPNVDAVIAKLRERAAVGLRKYGVTTADNPLTPTEWMQHLQEELMDACVYIEAHLKADRCDHEWVDARNEVVRSGYATITDFPYMGAASESRKQGLVDEFWCEHVPHARAALSATPLERYRAALEEIAVYPGLAQEIARKALEGE
jgi:hypothetical protein